MAIKRLPSTGDAPRSTGAPESLVPGGDADSAGFPWAGRTFDHHGTAFAGDDGSTPPELLEAVHGLRATVARGAGVAALAEAHAQVVSALSGCRLLVPLVAEAGDIGITPDGRTVEKTQELSIVTVAAPDGRRAMPVFSSVETMRAWNAEARPIPVPGPQAALAAAQEGTDLIIVDAGTPEQEFGVRRTGLEAMATGRRFVPGWADRDVIGAFTGSLRGAPHALAVGIAPGDPEGRLLASETDVILSVSPGMTREELGELLGLLQARWAADEAIAQGVDSLRVTIR